MSSQSLLTLSNDASTRAPVPGSELDQHLPKTPAFSPTLGAHACECTGNSKSTGSPLQMGPGPHSFPGFLPVACWHPEPSNVTGCTPQRLWGRSPQLLSRSKFKAGKSSQAFNSGCSSMPCSSRTLKLHDWVSNSNKAEDHQETPRQEIRKRSAGSLDDFSCTHLYFFIKFLFLVPRPSTCFKLIHPQCPHRTLPGPVVSGSGSSLQA